MKKTLAILLALAMVFSTITVAFAEEAISAEAKACVSVGMLQGEGTGVDAAYVAKAPNRLTAAILYLRLKGLEKAALAYTGTENFADVNQVNWAGGKAILGYLKTHPELGFIGDQGKFDPNAPMTAQAYYKVMLQALGYKQNVATEIGDFVYDKTIEFAASKGLTKVAAVKNFTINDVAIATVEALKANVKDSTTKTLAAQLIEQKVITEAAAVAAGVYNPAPVALAVESVTTDNLKQLTVKFNKELKDAGNTDNYTIETAGAAKLVAATSAFDLQADKKTVVITLSDNAAQQEKVDLTIEGLEATDGSKLAKTVVEGVELFDKTIPAALSAKVIGNDMIKVTFSEPINATTLVASNFKVDGGDLVVKSVTPANNNTEANVELYSVLDNDKVKIQAGSAVKDFAGFGIPKKEFELEVVKDTTAPVVVGFEDATPTGVTLIFNEDIQLVDGTASKFYHTNTADIVDNDITAADIDGNKLTLDFNTNKMPEGTAYVYLTKEVVSDYWDNENAKMAQTVQVTVDKTAPTVVKIEAGSTESQLKITFSEEMDANTSQDEDNYTILDKNGKTVENKILSATLTANTKGKMVIVVINFTEKMDGEYSIVIDKVEDKHENAIVKVTKAFNISDVTKPAFSSDFSSKLYSPGTEDQMLKVSFGDVMAVDGRYSVVDIEKYEYNGTNLSDFDGATIKAVDGNKAVEIALPYDATNADTYAFVAGKTLKIARVADSSNNVMPELFATLTVAAEGTIAVDTDAAVSPRLTAKDTIVITLLDRLSKFVSDDFIIKSNGTILAPSRVRHTLNDDGVSVITFTLTDPVNTNATTTASEFAITIDTAATTSSANIYGEKLATGSSIAIIDKAKPTLVSAIFADGNKDANGNVVTPSTITLTFSENLRANSFAVGKNGFSVSGGTLSTAALNPLNAKQVILTSTGDFFTVNTNVIYNSVAGIKDDKNGNTLADFTRTDILNK